VHDGESTRASSASRLIGGLRKRLSRRVLIGALRTLAIACGAFVSSRRWLLAALAITGVLLALISFVRPSPRHSFSAPGEPDILFDEVKNYPLGTKLADSRFRPELGDKPSPFNGDSKPAARLPKSPADGLAWEDGHRAGQSMPLSRRLDAVRSRRARGAWLTGTIESIAETPSSANEGQQQARGQAQDRVLR
jgi:hypothetical protein